MSHTPLQHSFLQTLHANPHLSAPVAAVQTLTTLLLKSQAETASELISILKDAVDDLKGIARQPIAITAGCQLFMRFVQVTARGEYRNFDLLKQQIITKANTFVELAHKRRDTVVLLAKPILLQKSIILVHSYSRVIMLLLREATDKNIQVYVTESRPSASGHKAVEELLQLGIRAKVILDAAVGYFIGMCDMVMVGAEGVVENGGVINQIGSYQIALIAKAHAKPFYVFAETYKFVRIFPLGQYDVAISPFEVRPIEFRPCVTSMMQATTLRERSMSITDTEADVMMLASKSSNGNYQEENDVNMAPYPRVDYTPPELITLLFTDIGVLTPSALPELSIKQRMVDSASEAFCANGIVKALETD